MANFETSTLAKKDLYWILRKLPKYVEAYLFGARDVWLGGGFIRACIAGEKPNDIDLFCTSKEDAKREADRVYNLTAERTFSGGAKIIETENAFTILGGPLPVQFIHRWTFKDASEMVQSFDFTISCAAIWKEHKQEWQSICHADFYQDLASKRLIYLSPVRSEDAGGSMLRVLKFYERGYRIPLDSLGAVMARLLMAVDMEAIEASIVDKTQQSIEGRVGEVLAGLLYEVDPNITDPERIAALKGGDE